jgi:hypothetical protein
MSRSMATDRGGDQDDEQLPSNPLELPPLPSEVTMRGGPDDDPLFPELPPDQGLDDDTDGDDTGL